MTTICTDGKTLAGDSMITASSEIWTYTLKVFHDAGGAVFGGCGSSVCNQRFARYMIEGGEWPELHESFSALVLEPDGTVYWVDKENERVQVSVPAAVGSGDQLAIGAMLAGATPGAAVAIAAMRNTGTGGEITELAPIAQPAKNSAAPRSVRAHSRR